MIISVYCLIIVYFLTAEKHLEKKKNNNGIFCCVEWVGKGVVLTDKTRMKTEKPLTFRYFIIFLGFYLKTGFVLCPWE